MDICSRINPLTESCDLNTKTEVQIQFSRHFFYPNLCHVCHRHDREYPLKKCGNCKMIYYCTKDHQRAHWPSHKSFCQNINSLKQIANNPTTVRTDLQKRFKKGQIDIKANLINLMETCMKRKLVPYENEIIEYPKVCEVCLEGDQRLLTSCPKCPHANFCKVHEELLQSDIHLKFCSFYLSCYILDYYAIVFQELPIPRMMEFSPRNSQIPKMPKSMQEYLDIFFKPPKEPKLNLPSEDVKMYVSQHFTRPLTLLYAMKKINFKPGTNVLIIHVIGASLREEKSSIEWEILFHWLPQLIKLKIILVGPELSNSNSIPKVKDLNLCAKCVSKEKALQIQTYNSLYIDYCEKENFEKPDIIVGFNIGIIAYNSWNNSILQISKLGCPFLLTAFSEEEANDDYILMKREFNVESSAYVEQNPFASLRPKRSPIGDKVFFENQFLIIYSNLMQRNNILEEKNDTKYEVVDSTIFDRFTSNREKEKTD